MAIIVRRDGGEIVLDTELGELRMTSADASIVALVLGWEAAQAAAPIETSDPLDAEPVPTEIVVEELAEEPAAPEETTDEVVS